MQLYEKFTKLFQIFYTFLAHVVISKNKFLINDYKKTFKNLDLSQSSHVFFPYKL